MEAHKIVILLYSYAYVLINLLPNSLLVRFALLPHLLKLPELVNGEVRKVLCPARPNQDWSPKRTQDSHPR